MKIWYAIRKPIGYLLFTALLYLVLIALHAIPAGIALLILGA
jgi:hypothetical protein